ncbi:MAG TPA: tripartite tricarboxylate transporter substrate binding protein [Burkholderiales bacterium]|nr:tripartite tricarboxylate transporter substrate binding protein [Burkholderiales bacterium]
MKTYALYAGVLLGLAVSAALAQDKSVADAYPSKAIRFIVPYAPGGPTDILARLLGQKFTERWGQPVVVDNRAGANGAIGAEMLAKSPADGSVLFLGNTSILTINPAVYRRLPYDADRHFQPVNLTVSAPLILVVHPSTGVKSVRDLVMLAKAPGVGLTFASSGTGGVSHMSGELMKALAKIELNHVPYKGAGPAALHVITGECAMTFTSTVSVMPHVKAGRLRGVAVTTPKRDALLPDIPAIAETIPGYDVSPWYGVLVPAGTPLSIVNKLHAETSRIVQAPDIAQRLAADGGTVVSHGPEEFAKIIQVERTRWARVVQTTGFKVD